MNRKQANEYKGKTVLVESHPDCVCYGILTDIHAPQNKTWEGTVKITGVHELRNPQIAFAPPCKEGDTVQVSGSKIYPFTGKAARTYRSSLFKAIHAYEKKTEHAIRYYKDQRKQLQEARVHLKTKHRNAEDPFLYFKLVEQNQEILLLEQSQNEKMILEGCPFEMDWYSTKRKSWVPVVHEYGWRFRTEDGKMVRLKSNDFIRIHKEQFEPFQILLNELEAPAKESLARLLHYFGFQRKHMVKCHNNLLRQLLIAEEEQHFSGVNFIMFQKNASMIVIQHRYERKLHEHKEDYVYDRFECTNELNERQVITYTNMQTSK